MVGFSRRFACFLVAVLLGAARPSPAQEQNFYAVIVGVSEFANLPKEEWLEFAHRDAEDFSKLIKSPRGRGFPTDNVTVLTNDKAGLLAMKRMMGVTLQRKVKSEDTVYIFIATHGMVEKEVSRAGYLLANDSDREDLYTTALAMKDLSDIIQNRLQKAKRLFLFADACRAGKLGQGQGNINRYMEESSKRGEMMGLLASRPNEFSREGKQFGGGHGVFTYFLLKGMMGEADSNKDNIVTAPELISYLVAQVEAATDKQQHVRDFGEFDPETPVAFVDKSGPEDLKLSRLPVSLAAALSPLWGGEGRGYGAAPGAALASLAPLLPEGDEVRVAFQRALREGRLLPPATDNAWDLYQRFTQLPVPQEQKEALGDDLIIALGTAGDRLLAAYRRGDQVIKLDAARYEEGAQLFSRASQLDPTDRMLQAKARFMEGRALVARGRYSDAISLLRQAVALDPDGAYGYNALGIAYMEQQGWNEAIENFREASARAEKWVYPHFNLAQVYFHTQRYREAEQEYKQGIALGTELGLKYFYLHNNLGVLYLNQGRLQEAEQQFRRALEMSADNPDAHYNLGLVFEQRGSRSQAEAYFRRAAELDARHVAARLRLAEIYRQRRDRPAEEQILRQAVAGDPQNAMALESLGRLLLEAKRLEEAEQVFMQMLPLDPNSPFPLIWLGDVHAAQRNFEQAAEDYRLALARTADPKLRRELHRKLEAVEKKK